MEPTKLIETVVGQGVLGVLLVLAVFALWRKDRENVALRDSTTRDLTEAMRQSAEATAQLRDRKDAEIAKMREAHAAELAEVNERRVQDVSVLGEKALQIQDKAISAVNRLADVAEATRGRS